MGSINSNTAAICVLALAWVMAGTVTAAAAKKPETPKAGFEISGVKLYTLPTNPVCGEPVRLVTEIRTTRPGKVDFTLLRRIGRSQKASLTIDGDGEELVERWEKQFTYNSSVKREYMVVINGHEFSTEWVPVEVACETRAHGLSHVAQN